MRPTQLVPLMSECACWRMLRWVKLPEMLMKRKCHDGSSGPDEGNNSSVRLQGEEVRVAQRALLVGARSVHCSMQIQA